MSDRPDPWTESPAASETQSTRPAPTRLEIASTWDDKALPEPEQSRVDLWLTNEHLRLTIDAPFYGDPPPAAKPGPTDRLWEHEVVELFVAGPGDDAVVEYTEIEIAPHGHHLVLRLRGVRKPWASGLPLDLETHIEGRRWRAQARLDRHLLPAAPWRVNAYGIHGPPENRRYRAAISVPGPTPDFHRPSRFAPWEPSRGIVSDPAVGASQHSRKR